MFNSLVTLRRRFGHSSGFEVSLLLLSFSSPCSSLRVRAMNSAACQAK